MENVFTKAENLFREAEASLYTALQNLKSSSIEKIDNKIRLNGYFYKKFVLIETDYNSPLFDTNIFLMTEFQNGTKSINRTIGIREYCFESPFSELGKVDVVEIINEFLLHGIVPEERDKEISRKLYLKPPSV